MNKKKPVVNNQYADMFEKVLGGDLRGSETPLTGKDENGETTLNTAPKNGDLVQNTNPEKIITYIGQLTKNFFFILLPAAFAVAFVLKYVFSFQGNAITFGIIFKDLCGKIFPWCFKLFLFSVVGQFLCELVFMFINIIAGKIEFKAFQKEVAKSMAYQKIISENIKAKEKASKGKQQNGDGPAMEMTFNTPKYTPDELKSHISDLIKNSKNEKKENTTSTTD